MKSEIENRIDHGARFPYDAPDDYTGAPDDTPPPPTDWAHAAARGCIADLRDRRGIKWGFDDIDEEIRSEIVSTLAAIIRYAAAHCDGQAA